MFKRIVVLVLGIASYGIKLNGQTIPVGAPGTDDWLRSLQLMGKIDPDQSLTARPFFTSSAFTPDSLFFLTDKPDAENTRYKNRHQFGKNGVVELLPVTWLQQYNSHHPYGWNNAGMIAAKGYQTMLSAGVYASMGPVSVQIRPEFVYAANPNFEYNADYGSPTSGNYHHFFPGQSSVRINVGAISAGISTESLWWGPGIHNSLVMSNNAPGFPHLTFNSTRPVKTPVGSFEWQLVGGKLQDAKNLLYENYYMKPDASLIYLAPEPIDHDWRYFNGLVLTYHPKWTPGLFLGLTRAFHVYHNDLKLNGSFLDKYLPVFSAFQKDQTTSEDQKRRDQVTSLFARWVLAKEQIEIYGEYGWNDHSYNMDDFWGSPTHSASYLAGIRKLFPLRENQWLDFNFELTQMQQSPDYLVRDAGNWYWHYQLLQGYTNNNQIIGAGVGSGNNVQTITATWINGWKKLGVVLERLENNPQYHAVKWTDLSLGFTGQWNFGHWLLNAKLQGISSRHYAWDINKNRFNLWATTGISYRW